MEISKIRKSLRCQRKTLQKASGSSLGQNIQLDYQSGYFADFIGFDASYYGAIKLAASKDFASRAILYNDDGEAKGYNKIGQRYAKFKLDLEPVNFNGKAGWFTLKTRVFLLTPNVCH